MAKKKATGKQAATRKPRKAKKEAEEVVEETAEEEEPEVEKAPVHSPTEPEVEAAALPKPEIVPVETLEEALELFEGCDIKASKEYADEFVVVVGPSNTKHHVPKAKEEEEAEAEE